MAKVITTELQHSGASAANITLDSSKNVTCENNLQVDGNVTVTGTLPADKLTGNLPAISGASLTGISSPLSFRNLIINGAMQVAQRGTSSTTSGYGSLDRWKPGWGGADEAITHAQHALTSSDTGPWAKGFRNSLHLTNGNQTSGAGAADYLEILYTVEAQDMANSGWDYTSASSNITISFWAQASVAQTYYVYLQSLDGTAQLYAFSFALSANTWTKVTKTIPGAANVAFDDNNGGGLRIGIVPFYGTDYTTSGFTLNTWAAQTGSNMMPDMTSTWWTTNDATFEITGVQLEVGDTATDFEHRSYGEELARCQRYYYMQEGDTNDYMCTSMAKNGAALYFFFNLPVPMRTYPSITGNASDVRHFSSSSSDDFASSGLVLSHYNTTYYWGNGQTTTVLYYEGANASGGQGGMMQCQENGVKLQFSAEL